MFNEPVPRASPWAGMRRAVGAAVAERIEAHQRIRARWTRRGVAVARLGVELAVPDPGAGEDAVERGVLGTPVEFALDFFR